MSEVIVRAKLRYVDTAGGVWSLPFQFDARRAASEGFRMPFVNVEFVIDPDAQLLDPDPYKVVSALSNSPQRVHLINADHACEFTLCGALPVADVRRRTMADCEHMCHTCKQRSR